MIRENLIFTSPIGTNGRLSNSLFQIAYVVGLAKKYNALFLFPNWEYSKFFKNWVYADYSFSPTHVYRESSFNYAEFSFKECHQLEVDYGYQIIEVHGYFQSERHFDHCKQDVLKLFEFNDDIVVKCQEMLNIISSFEPGAKFTSIHFRNGDYVNNPYYYNIQDSDYYINAINKILECGNGPDVFLIFSDEPALAKKYMLNLTQKSLQPIKYYIVEGNSDIEDLCLMSLTSNQICANSSYSWWGNILNRNENKISVYPKNWFSGNGIINNTCDLYPKNALVL